MPLELLIDILVTHAGTAFVSIIGKGCSTLGVKKPSGTMTR